MRGELAALRIADGEVALVHAHGGADHLGREVQEGRIHLAEGNARVLTARLKDARFFWENDKARGPDGTSNFDRWLRKLEGVTFHAKLGSMADRVERIVALAGRVASIVNVDQHIAAEAARLAKADLASGMVSEFPELQGIMGGYYAREAGAADELADAIRDHYKPVGPNDAVPTAPLTLVVALADKLDTLAGFFAIGEKPTGSRDPYALRRAALGVIRILLTGGIRAPLRQLFAGARAPAAIPVDDLAAFFADRLKVQLRDEGRRHDLVDAVFALGDDDLVRIVARVEALDGFLKTEDGKNLLAGYKRAANILKAEVKKNPAEAEAYSGPVDPAKFVADEETALHAALEAAAPNVATELEAEHFEAAMAALAGLRGPVDAFFDQVLVNADDAAVRQNRLRLLAQVQRAMGEVADFSLVAG